MRFSCGAIQPGHQTPSLLLVGAGRMGGHHRRAVARGMVWSLVGWVDRHLPADPAALPGFGPDLALELQRTRPFAAIVAVPPDAHQEVALTCLEHGCHVLVEKPICGDYSQAVALVQAFRRRGKVLFGGHSERFHPCFQFLQRQLSRVGRLHLVEAVRQGPRPVRVWAGGVVMDLAVHDLDLVRRLVGEPLRLDGGAVVEFDQGGAAFACAALRWSQGQAEVQAAWGAPRRWIRVTGSAGTLEADLLGRSLVFTGAGGRESIDVPWNDPLEAEQAAFLAACLGVGDPWADLLPQLEAVDLAGRILAGG